MSMADQTMKLTDGRALGYVEYGDPSGIPVFFFHGFPASRLEGAILDIPARETGVRLIAPDRPGFGLSDPKPGRSFSDWAEDIIQLSSHLRIYDFAILGTSGGAPYVVSCAERIAERLIGAGVVSGLSPLRNPAVRQSMSADQLRVFVTAARTPWLARQMLARSIQDVQTDFPSVLKRMTEGWPEADQAVLARPEIREMLRVNLIEAFRQGVTGPAQELALYRGIWAFAPQKEAFAVQLWYGRKDTVTPPVMAEELASLLPRTLTRWYRDEGHMLLFDRAQEILHQLTNWRR